MVRDSFQSPYESLSASLRPFGGDALSSARGGSPLSGHSLGFESHAVGGNANGFGGFFAPKINVTHNLTMDGGRPVPVPVALEVQDAGHGPVFGGPVSPSMADEIAFLNGLDSSNNIAATSYWTWNGNKPATYAPISDASKWGADHPNGATITLDYFFTPASNWTAEEQGVFQSCLALWSAVSNVHFNLTTVRGDAEIIFKRGHDGSAYESDTPNSGVGAGVVGGSTMSTKDKVTISVDTSVPGFGPVDGDFTSFGGYVFGTLVHEMGHMLGLGHAGPYNGNITPMTQQYSAYDSLIWSIMSYVAPHEAAKYDDSYPVQADWGVSPDGYHNTATTWMPLDILAVQQLYGTPGSSPLGGNQTFGFNTNITGDLKNFFDFTVNVNPVITLWSLGTNNTLDLSGFDTASTVNLNPGTFTSCDGHTNNIGLAFNTVFETAIGGKGGDTFIANTLADTFIGNKGGDTFVFADSMTAADTVNGGAGLDTLSLAGDYAGLVFGATTMTGVETILLGAAHDYALTLDNANVANAGALSVDGSALGAGDVLSFNGSGEKKGALTVTGGAANDTLTTGGGADTVRGGLGSDTMTAGKGADSIAYGPVGDSTSVNFDQVVGFDFDSVDSFDFGGSVTGVDSGVSGALTTANFDSDLAGFVTGAQLAAHHALLFTGVGGDYNGKLFLVVDADGSGGYTGGSDYVVMLTNAKHAANFDLADFS